MTRRIERLRVVVDSAPDPFLLRSAIEARLRGAVWPRPAEDAVGKSVRDAIDGPAGHDSDGEDEGTPAR